MVNNSISDDVRFCNNLGVCRALSNTNTNSALRHSITPHHSITTQKGGFERNSSNSTSRPQLDLSAPLQTIPESVATNYHDVSAKTGVPLRMTEHGKSPAKKTISRSQNAVFSPRTINALTGPPVFYKPHYRSNQPPPSYLQNRSQIPRHCRKLEQRPNSFDYYQQRPPPPPPFWNHNTMVQQENTRPQQKLAYGDTMDFSWESYCNNAAKYAAENVIGSYESRLKDNCSFDQDATLSSMFSDMSMGDVDSSRNHSNDSGRSSASPDEVALHPMGFNVENTFAGQALFYMSPAKPCIPPITRHSPPPTALPKPPLEWTNQTQINRCLF